MAENIFKFLFCTFPCVGIINTKAINMVFYLNFKIYIARFGVHTNTGIENQSDYKVILPSITEIPRHLNLFKCMYLKM